MEITNEIYSEKYILGTLRMGGTLWLIPGMEEYCRLESYKHSLEGLVATSLVREMERYGKLKEDIGLRGRFFKITPQEQYNI